MEFRIADTFTALFEQVNKSLAENNLYTESALYTRIAETVKGFNNPPYDFIIVDEAQDLSYAQMRFVAALGAHRHDTLCFCGDLGQRIFQLPFSWKSLGVDIRGRSITLRVNYRTSHQIRRQADKLLDVYNTERQLLYVACTRARDHLMISGTEPISEFIEDF